MSDFNSKVLGEKGAIYVTGTSANAGAFCALQALDETVIASMTAPGISGTLTSVPLPRGSIIYGKINSFTLTSGKVLAYKR